MFLTVRAELHELAACMRHGPCSTEGIVAVDVSHLDKGSREFLDVLGISPELIAISILAFVLLLDVEVEFHQQDDTTMSWVSAGCFDLISGNVLH